MEPIAPGLDQSFSGASEDFPALLRRRDQSRQRQAIGRACCEVLEGRRLLSFTPAVNHPVGTNPLDVVTADFNNDGHLDVATANAGNTPGISVLLGDGAGGFGAAIGTAAGYRPDDFLASMAVADFNEDGNLDLATAFYGVTLESGQSGFEWWDVRVLLGNGQGGFAWVPQNLNPIGYGKALSVVVGDFNNDGNSDVVAFGEYDSFGYYAYWYGNGHGQFTTLGSIQQSLPYAAQAVGDLNGDGNLDLVWDIDGDYHFISQSGVAIGDFTGEGIPDEITAVSSVKVHVGRGDGTFDSPPFTQAANGNLHTGVAVADFNADGKLDAVTSDWDEGTVSALLGNGNGTLSYVGALATGSSPSAVAVGDFNGDGRPDVAVTNSGSANVSVLLNDGVWAGTKSYTGPSGGNWSTAANWTPSGVPAASDNVSIAGKTVNVASNVTVAGLTLTGGAKLNLNDKQLTLTYAGTSPIGSWNGSAYTGITGMIQSGRNGGAWNGAGIITTMSDAIGAAARKTLGVSQTANSVIVRYTFAGDAHLTGGIDGDDFFAIDSGYASQARGYANGDFNYSGAIDADDYFAIDSNYSKAQTQLAPLLTSELPKPILFAADDYDSAYMNLMKGIA